MFKQLTLSFLLLISCFEVSSQQVIKKATYKNQEVYVYPYRIPLYNSFQNVPPYYGSLPDGKYIAYYAYQYYYKFSIWKMGQKERVTDSTIVACEFEIKKNQKNGYWISHRSDGTISDKGNFKNDLKDSIWSHYLGNKTLTSEFSYKNGLKNGPYTIYNSLKVVIKKGFMENDIPVKEETQFHNNGKLFYNAKIIPNEFYKPGFFNYEEIGNAFNSLDYIGEKQIPFRRNPYTEESIIYDGKIDFYYDNGQKAMTIFSSNGMVDWIDTARDKNGRVTLVYHTDNPKLPLEKTTITKTRYFRYKNNEAIEKEIHFPNGTVEASHKVKMKENDYLEYFYSKSFVQDSLKTNEEPLFLYSTERRINYRKKKYITYTRNYYIHKKSGNLFEETNDGTMSTYCKNISHDENSKITSYVYVDSLHDGSIKLESYWTKNQLVSSRRVYVKHSELQKIYIDNKTANGKFIILPFNNKNKLYSHKVINGVQHLYFDVHETEEGVLKDGLPDGVWISKRKNFVQEITHYKNGLLNGEKIVYEKHTITNDERQMAIDCNIKGRKYTYIKSIHSYLEDEKHGDQVIFDAFGNILEFGQYNHGKKNGRFEKNRDDGQLILSEEFKNDKREGEYTDIKYARRFKSFRKGKKYEYGYVWEKEFILQTTFLGGKINGAVKIYHDNFLKVDGQAKNGQAVGVWKFYMGNPDQAYFTIDYADGLTCDVVLGSERVYNKEIIKPTYHLSPDDDHLYYAENEIIFEASDNQKGNGFFCAYYPNGDTCMFGEMKYNLPTGNWWLLGENGVRLKNFDFKADTIVLNKDTVVTQGKITTYHPNGKKNVEGLIRSWEYVYDCVSFHHIPTPEIIYLNIWNEKGEQTLVKGSGYVYEKNEKGLITAEGEMHNNERIGLWKFYNESGSLIEIGNYIMGKKDGKWLQGDLSGLNLDGLNCFDPNDPSTLKAIEFQKKLVFLKESIYDNGTLLQENTFNLNLNKNYRR